MFQQLLPAAFIEQAQKDAGVRGNNRVYTPLVVMWLLILQRLLGAASLETAVLRLLQDLPPSFWPRPCKRIREWRERGKPMSSNTGAYNQARQALPLPVVQQSCDRIFDGLMRQMTSHGDEPAMPAFVLDGSSMRMAHSPSLSERFPPGWNQHGEGHWPMVRVRVAHNLWTGLAMRPEWGPMHGPEAVSEQRLLETAIGRLPAAAAVIGDSNFGVFSVAWSALQTNHPVLLRLSSPRARRLLGGRTLNDGIDREVVWRCSRDDRKKHPDLPEDACVRGRVLVMRVQPDNGAAAFLLMLFTTLPVSRRPLLKLYGQRWNIETDLRTLKTQLRMDQLSCATPDMVAREIEMSIAAYNLVRAMIYLASEQSGFPPRQYGFTRASRVVLSFAPRIAMALNDQDAKRLFDQMMHYLQQARRPPRRRLPSPRHVWGKGAKFPNRKC